MVSGTQPVKEEEGALEERHMLRPYPTPDPQLNEVAIKGQRSLHLDPRQGLIAMPNKSLPSLQIFNSCTHPHPVFPALLALGPPLDEGWTAGF